MDILLEKRQDTSEHALDRPLVYLQSSIVHCPVHTQWREGFSVLMHGDVTLFVLIMQETAVTTPIRQVTRVTYQLRLKTDSDNAVQSCISS